MQYLARIDPNYYEVKKDCVYIAIKHSSYCNEPISIHIVVIVKCSSQLVGVISGDMPSDKNFNVVEYQESQSQIVRIQCTFRYQFLSVSYFHNQVDVE